MIDIKNLYVTFPIAMPAFMHRKIIPLHAVKNVSLTIRAGETLGLVGESGCGKSTFGRAILQLIRASSGSVSYNGQDLCALSRAELKPYRRQMQMVFQDPFSSLNPRITVGESVMEPMKIHGTGNADERRREAARLFEIVHLDPRMMSRFPHEFSGGQRQRIGIARALALKPEFIVCDEAVSALDVSNQAQILNLLEDLRERLGLTYLFIAHDLAVVRRISDRVAVMYMGEIVELAPRTALYEKPLHPYTRGLLDAVPSPDPTKRSRKLIQGDPPNPLAPPSGCPFRTRCPHAMAVCASEMPPFREVENGHWAACYLYEDVPAGMDRPQSDESQPVESETHA